MRALKSFINRRRRKPVLRVVRVQTSAEGFEAVWNEGGTEALSWSEVERIFTYKMDCFAYDVIWLAFERRGHDGALHISEEAEGFENLMGALAKALPGINPDWYFNVMKPAFAENLTVLFEGKAEA